MLKLKSELNYDLNSQNLYLKQFQIAVQNLTILLKEEKSSALPSLDRMGKKEESCLNNRILILPGKQTF